MFRNVALAGSCTLILGFLHQISPTSLCEVSSGARTSPFEVSVDPTESSAWERIDPFSMNTAVFGIALEHFEIVDFVGDWTTLSSDREIVRRAGGGAAMAITDRAGVLRLIEANSDAIVVVRPGQSLEYFAKGLATSAQTAGTVEDVQHCANKSFVLSWTMSGSCWSASVLNPASGCRETKCDRESGGCTFKIDFTTASGLTDYEASGTCPATPIEVVASCSGEICWNFGAAPASP